MLNFYIVKDIEQFKQTYSDFGFEESKKVIYPKRVTRVINDDLKDKYIDICIDKKCINMWDGQDKNRQGEVWVEDLSGYGCCRADYVEPYIQDLIKQEIVELIER